MARRDWEGNLTFESQAEALAHLIETEIGMLGLVEMILEDTGEWENLLTEVRETREGVWTY